MKGVKDVSTLKELEIAKTLSLRRANIFLESRAYIRKSLGALFNIEPLKIPLIANPGEPPQLPDGMGNLSFSHCNDAIIIVWHTKKIGVDIERLDRKFNYKNVAKKYFSKSYKSKHRSKLTKTMVLNQWCAVEAAIKWDHGKLAQDIKEWQYYKDENQLIHKKKDIVLKFTQIIFDQWNICFTVKENTCLAPNIICSYK